MPVAAPRHTLVVLDPGHFHAALTLRERNPRLAEEVHVYAPDGPDLERFLSVVRAFNQRAEAPTHWKTQVYRGVDCLERLCADRPGDVAVVAGRNDGKMSAIHRLHASGFFVLGDKPWLIDPRQLPLLEEVATTAPIAMDIMTERHDIANRALRALTAQTDFFGSLRCDDEPAIHIRSVHHLCKTVNGRPLVRPAWYFDTAVQGEGITDVTTHLVDLAQWLVGGGPFHYATDVELLSARQWPTEVPLASFAQATGLSAFPRQLADRVDNGMLHLLCNASTDFRLRNVPARVEAVWELAPPEGGGDTQHARVRGTRAELVIEHNAGTGFVPELLATPAQPGGEKALAQALASLQSEFPGLGMQPAPAGGYRIAIPPRLRTTHEQHFARVLDRFLDYVDGAQAPTDLGANLVARYTLLARAAERARAAQP